jgi:hypothetical protein
LQHSRAVNLPATFSLPLGRQFAGVEDDGP